jgi:hypothetical protein
MGPPGYIYIDKYSDHETILRKAKEISELRKAKEISDQSLFLRVKIFLKKFYLFRIWNNVRVMYRNNNMFFQSKASFDQIIYRYGIENITCLHIPYKEEVTQRSYDNLSRRARDYILSRNIAYIDGLALCGLTEDDFQRVDPHLNDSGYVKLLNCLLTYGLGKSFTK